MKGRKCPGASANLSSAKGNVISHNWCVSSGGISLGFKNSLFWAEEASPLAALLHDKPSLVSKVLGLISPTSLCWLINDVQVSEGRHVHTNAAKSEDTSCSLSFAFPSSLSQHFHQGADVWLSIWHMLYCLAAARRKPHSCCPGSLHSSF